MTLSPRRFASGFAALLATAALLRAHPGHDDGHELTWDLGHLAAHPLATAGCLAVLAAGAWVGVQLLRRGAEPARVQSLRTSHPSRGK